MVPHEFEATDGEYTIGRVPKEDCFDNYSDAFTELRRRIKLNLDLAQCKVKQYENLMSKLPSSATYSLIFWNRKKTNTKSKD